nr:AAA family ATPase [Bacillus cihuensis]
MLPLESYIRRVELKREAIPSFDTYPFSLPAVRPLTNVELHPNITFFVGENGMGKSTLLEAFTVAFGFNAEGGTINFNFSTKETHSNLYEYVRLVKGTKKPRDGFFLRAETFYPALTSSKSPTSRFRGIEEA